MLQERLGTEKKSLSIFWWMRQTRKFYFLPIMKILRAALNAPSNGMNLRFPCYIRTHDCWGPREFSQHWYIITHSSPSHKQCFSLQESTSSSAPLLTIFLQLALSMGHLFLSKSCWSRPCTYPTGSPYFQGYKQLYVKIWLIPNNNSAFQPLISWSWYGKTLILVLMVCISSSDDLLYIGDSRHST
jgi:hypothetical protein